MSEFDDELSAFQRFIEEGLNLNGLGETPVRLPPGYAPVPRPSAEITRDVQATWQALIQHDSGSTYWGQLLTAFERRVRANLQEEILQVLGAKFGEQVPDRELRSIIAYSMTVGWLVLGTLSAKYSAEDADDDSPDVSNLF